MSTITFEPIAPIAAPVEEKIMLDGQEIGTCKYMQETPYMPAQYMATLLIYPDLVSGYAHGFAPTKEEAIENAIHNAFSAAEKMIAGASALEARLKGEE